MNKIFRISLAFLAGLALFASCEKPVVPVGGDVAVQDFSVPQGLQLKVGQSGTFRVELSPEDADELAEQCSGIQSRIQDGAMSFNEAFDELYGKSEGWAEVARFQSGRLFLLTGILECSPDDEQCEHHTDFGEDQFLVFETGFR